MRVLLVRSKSTGGIGVHVAALAAGLDAAGHQVAVLEATGRSAMRDIRRAATGADVVHAHGLRAGTAACAAAAFGRQRIVVTLHNAVPPGRLGALLASIVARRAHVVLGASRDLVDEARRRGAGDARFAPVVATLGPTTKTREAAREEFDLAPDGKLVLAVGRLAPQKDYATLLDAAERLGERVATHPLLTAIAGDGPLRAELQYRIDAEHLSVRLLGHRTDVPDLLAAADVFVMCSTWEARPLALQEAMRAGLRCVATRVGGVPELVGEAAILVRPGDSEELCHAIAERLRPDAAGAGAPREFLTTPPTPREQAATWPGPAEELAAVLDAYRP